jgi:hypothetical protein
MVVEDGEEDRAEDCDSERARELLHGLEDARGGTDLIHADTGQNEPEQLPDRGTDTDAHEEKAGDEVPAPGLAGDLHS